MSVFGKSTRKRKSVIIRDSITDIKTEKIKKNRQEYGQILAVCIFNKRTLLLNKRTVIRTQITGMVYTGVYMGIGIFK